MYADYHANTFLGHPMYPSGVAFELSRRYFTPAELVDLKLVNLNNISRLFELTRLNDKANDEGLYPTISAPYHIKLLLKEMHSPNPYVKNLRKNYLKTTSVPIIKGGPLIAPSSNRLWPSSLYFCNLNN